MSGDSIFYPTKRTPSKVSPHLANIQDLPEGWGIKSMFYFNLNGYEVKR